MSGGFFCDVYFALLHRQERKAAVYIEVKEKTVHDLSVRKFLETNYCKCGETIADRATVCVLPDLQPLFCT